MSSFSSYLILGFQHILNLQAIDHLLFILSVTSMYRLYDFKKLLLLITAFTVGHSFTLALATLQWVHFSQNLIEFLIPCTILISAISNLGFTEKKFKINQRQFGKYWMVAGFGLIHGLGFSNYLQSLLGKEVSILTPLLAFNLGLEIGQIIVVLLFLSTATLFVEFFKTQSRTYILVISGIIIGLTLPMLLERL